MLLPGVKASGVFFNILGFSPVVAIVIGVRRNKPNDRLAWYLLAAAQALFVAGDALTYNWQRLFHTQTPFPSVADILYLSVYPCAVAGLLRLMRRRSDGADRAGFVDALIVTLGAGLVSWVFLMAPYAHDSGDSLLLRLTAIAYPLMDLAVLAVLVRLAVGSGERALSFRLLIVGAIALLCTDAVFGWINLHGEYTAGSPLDLGWLAFYFLWGAAALHPSMRRLDRPVTLEPHQHVRRRLAILAAAALLGPIVEVIQHVTHGPPEVWVVASCTAVMFVLVLLRLDGAMVDIGQYRKAERTAREAERKYRSLVEDLPAIVFQSDADEEGRFRYMSPRVEEILGYPAEAFLGDSAMWRDTIDARDRERVLSARTEALRGGARLRTEYRMRASDGRVVWIRHEAQTIDNEDGTVVRHGVLYDITDIKRAEEALRAALAKEKDAAAHLRELDEMKNSFLQAVSHDLRTPLTTILGAALTLERDDIELTASDQRDLATRIAANARRLNRLLTNLLDLDRISRGIVEPNRHPVDLRSLATVALEHVPLDGRRLRLEIAPLRAEVDSAQVERILENLVVNAVRYTPPDSTIDVSIGETDGGILICVDDRGPGIPEAQRERIFEPFQQGAATQVHAPGVGIGLSLVARFAKLHRGRAWVEPRPGGGSSFRVWLLAPTELIGETADAPQTTGAGTPTRAARPVPGVPAVSGARHPRR